MKDKGDTKRLNIAIDKANSLIRKSKQKLKYWSEVKAKAHLDKEDAIKEIEKITKQPKALEVSDHAFIRYLERYCGYDIRKLKEEMVGNIKGFVGNEFSGKFKVEGITYVVAERVVVTIT